MRRLLATHRSLTLLVLAAVLVLRVFVPSGFMPVVGQGGIAIVLCSGFGPETLHGATGHRMMPGMHHSSGKDDGAGHDPPCAFAGVAMPAIGGADAVQLAAALLFTLVLGLAASLPLVLPGAPRLRPPGRGPPVLR